MEAQSRVEEARSHELDSKGEEDYRVLAVGLTVLSALTLSLLAEAQQAEVPKLPSRGSFEIRKEGELSGVEVGAARFEPDQAGQKLDGQPAFIVGLLTGVIEGGIFLVFGGAAPPETGEYSLARADIKGMGSYKEVDLGPGEVAVFYFDMGRNHLVLLGSTGDGSIEILESNEEHIQGRLDVVVKGATGNPNSFMGVRPREGTLVGSFDATPGEVDFRKP